MVQNAHFLGSGPDLSAADAPKGQLGFSCSIWARKSGDDYGDRFGSNSAEVRLFTMTDSIKSRNIMEERLSLSLTSAVFFFRWIPEVSIWVIDNALQQSRY